MFNQILIVLEVLSVEAVHFYLQLTPICNASIHIVVAVNTVRGFTKTMKNGLAGKPR